MVDRNGDEILYQDETTNWANKLIVAYKDRDILGRLTNIIELKWEPHKEHIGTYVLELIQISMFKKYIKMTFLALPI